MDLNYNLRIFYTLILLFYIQRFGLIRAGKTRKNKEITNLFIVAIIVNVPNIHLNTSDAVNEKQFYTSYTSIFMHIIYILLFKFHSCSDQ